LLVPRFFWRPLFPGENDPELTWGLVIAVGGILAIGWLLSGLPTPLCPLHILTGFPCPTCGMTRGFSCLLHGHLEAAILFNPLLMALVFGITLYLLYCVVVVSAGLPRLRWEPLTKITALAVRVGVVALIAGNWIYLIVRERAL
jgi:hypothetical protein